MDYIKKLEDKVKELTLQLETEKSDAKHQRQMKLTAREQRGKIVDRLKSISLTNLDLINQNSKLLTETADAFGDGYYEGFIDGAKHHEATDCNTDPTYLGEDAMRCSEIAENTKSKRIGITSRGDLIAQRAELVAQIGELKSSCQLAIDMFKVNDINVPNTIETLEDAINATPTQCLRQIQADAGRAGFIAGCDSQSDNDWTTATQVENAANRHATKVRQGGEL